MAELSYFQRYSQRENHITNNVLLMLRMLYRSHPTKLQSIIEGIMTNSGFESLELNIGPVFKQQVGSSDSIPDAIISQQSFMIMVEVKPGEKWNKKQIIRHIKSAATLKQKNSILLLLSTADEPNFDEKLLTRAEKAGVQLIHTTFEDLINLIDSDGIVGSHETDLQDIVDDFRDVLWEEGLLNDPYEMFAFGCSQTLNWNLENKIYYDYVSRPSKAKVLTGFYSNREIHAIGKIAATVIGSPALGFEVETEHPDKSDAEIVKRVKKAVTSIADSFSDESLRWYIYDELYKTSFKKKTPYGYFQGVWIHLEDYVDEEIDPSNLKKVAKNLKGQFFGNDRGYGE